MEKHWGTFSICESISCAFIYLFFIIFFKEELFLKKFYLFIYFWLCWVFVSVRGLSLVAASGGHSSSRCTGLSLSRPLLLWSTGSRRAGSAIVAHGPSCSAACGIFPDQGSNPCPLHWQVDSQPLRHQGSPCALIFKKGLLYLFGIIFEELLCIFALFNFYYCPLKKEECQRKKIQEINNQKANYKIEELEKAKQRFEQEIYVNKKRLEMETLATKQVISFHS